MSVFKKILLLLAIIGGINWGIYGIWGFNAVGWFADCCYRQRPGWQELSGYLHLYS